MNGAEPEPVRERRDRRGQVRVRTGLLTDLVNYAGEVSISRSRMEQQVYGLRENLAELNRNITRFRDQIRELEIQSDSQILYSVSQAAGEAGAAQAGASHGAGAQGAHQWQAVSHQELVAAGLQAR